ncbi:GIN domain-containing protein [Flavobacterium sp. GT2N3]|uniref:GIN domain-containing protein n=1 Tax=unclassified Flavobacterium TaxID=196869 RepID=UPI003AACBE34
MKKYTAILLLLLSTTFTFAQKKEKIKGSKTVTIEHREVGNFESLTVEDNLEVHLERGEKTELKIEADENLHNIISLDLRDNMLRIYTTKQAANYKKLIIRVTYSNDLNLITSKNEATVNAIQEILLNDLTLRTYDTSKLFLNVSAKNFVLQSDDKSKIELNLKSENTTIELSKNASLKALVATTDLKVDLYQKSEATIEGDATNAIIRTDNNSSFTGNKLVVKNVDVTTESYSNCSVNAVTTVIIDAADKSEIQLVGAPKIEIRKFVDEAKLIKKLK